MKKLTAILLALILLMSLTACEDAISKLLYRKNDANDSKGTVQAQEPVIPDTTPSGGDAPVTSTEPADPAAPTEPTVSQPEPDGPAEPAVKDETQPEEKITASHSDVSLFSAGESFTMSVRGVSGVCACSFASANPEIAAVDETAGVITAVSPGMTTVTMHVECSEGQFDFDCIVRCRWNAEEPDLPSAEADAEASGPSLSGFFSTLQSTYEGLSRMMVMDTQLLDSYYPGLTDVAAVEEILIQETAMSMANMAVGLVRLSDSASAEDILKVQSILQSRITAQANGGAFYPASCETWENGVITSVSNCVGMFVYPDEANAMATLFTDTFSN